MNNLILSFIIFISTATFACTGANNSCQQGERETASSSNPTLTENQVLVPKIHCKGCAYKIRKELKSLDGVSSVKVDVKTKVVDFDCQSCDKSAVYKKLEEIGYPAEKASAI